MGFLLVPAAPILVMVAILIGIAYADGGIERARLMGYPYVGPLLMFAWATLMHQKSGMDGDWRQTMLTGFGLVAAAVYVWILIRCRRAKWRWMLLANSLPLILLSALVWFWGSFWMWVGP